MGLAQLGSGKAVFSVPGSTPHVGGRLAGCPALQAGLGTADGFLELAMRLPVSPLHWQPAQVALRPGSWSLAL